MRQKISVRALIKKEGKVLLLRRSLGRESIIGKYELLGGKLNFGEQPRDALLRHVQHAIGVEVETSQLFDTVSFIDPDDQGVQYVFIVYMVSIEQRQLSLRGKYDKYSWESMSEIQRTNLTNSTEVLLRIDQPPSVQGVESSSDPLNGVNKTSDSVIIYSDGGSRGNPGPSASAFVIMDQSEQILAEGGVYIGVTTNNQAEYQAVYQALKKAVELKLPTIDFRIDSSLVVNQLNGIYKIKNRDLWPIHEKIKELLPHFERITFSHVRREFNQIADSLVNKILDEHISSQRGGGGTIKGQNIG